jgi:hypothetical protein
MYTREKAGFVLASSKKAARNTMATTKMSKAERQMVREEDMVLCWGGAGGMASQKLDVEELCEKG